jgi:hypothetical protein
MAGEREVSRHREEPGKDGMPTGKRERVRDSQ